MQFEKNVKAFLPYNREKYRALTGWYGVSFQMNNQQIPYKFTDFVSLYAPFFQRIVISIDNESNWIINHDDKDLEWFPNNENNLTSLRNLFKSHNIPNKFKGALIFSKTELLEFSTELISYPFAVCSEHGLLYKNLDVSNGRLEFVIKISGHLNIDLISTDKIFLKKIVNENSTVDFIVKSYRGTVL